MIYQSKIGPEERPNNIDNIDMRNVRVQKRQKTKTKEYHSTETFFIYQIQQATAVLDRQIDRQINR